MDRPVDGFDPAALPGGRLGEAGDREVGDKGGSARNREPGPLESVLEPAHQSGQCPRHAGRGHPEGPRPREKPETVQAERETRTGKPPGHGDGLFPLLVRKRPQEDEGEVEVSCVWGGPDPAPHRLRPGRDPFTDRPGQDGIRPQCKEVVRLEPHEDPPELRPPIVPPRWE